MKKRVLEVLTSLDEEDMYRNIWNYTQAIDQALVDNEFHVGLIRVKEESYSYIMGLYRSDKIGKTLIMDWDFKERYESLDQLAETITAMDTNGKIMEAALEYSQDRYLQIIKQQNQAKDKEQSHDHER